MSEPTPCLKDNRWISADHKDAAEAVDGCLGCPALYRPHDALGGISCTDLRANLVTDPEFRWFAGTIAAITHDPDAEKREREKRYRDNARSKGRREPAPRAPITHCKRGHHLDERNVYMTPSGKRTCRTCLRASKAEWEKRQKDDAGPKPTRTHCFRGHPFDDENTDVDDKGTRRCKECRRIAGKARYDRRINNTSRNNAA